ncbi:MULTISPECIES: hypothetical protein [Brevibacillus]|jgi:hypothetical protein|nr:hypothetical protein [Brevibacillus borstelensis]MED2007177.1 hypothetical protein [Brevibacillus borstelensis]
MKPQEKDLGSLRFYNQINIIENASGKKPKAFLVDIMDESHPYVIALL